MTLRCGLLGIMSLSLGGLSPAALADEMSQSRPTDTATTADDGLTRAIRPEPEPPIDPFKLVLRLPTELIELGFTPLLPVAVLLDRTKLIQRFIELVTNDDLTMALIPIVEPFSGSGPGFGAAYLFNQPLGSPDRLVVLGLIRTNRDRNFSLSFGRRLPSLSGQAITLSAGYSVNHDTRYFGIGERRPVQAERLMRTDAVDLSAGITLPPPRMLPEFLGTAQISYRRRRLGTGEGSQAPPLTATDDILAPPGFRRGLDYLEGTANATYDSRDSFGRTTRGILASLEGTATHDFNGGRTGGLLLTAQAATFIPVLPLFRVLFLSAGVSAAIPIFASSLPLHLLPALGGASRLRGYQNNRFIDRIAWWATAEYRFRFYEYEASSMQLSAALFVDTGQVGHDPDELFEGPLPYSVGIGIRAEQNLVLLGRVQLAYSPEGFRITVGFGEVL